MSKNYTIVNPFIEGSFKNNFSGNSSKEGAEKAWLSLSKNIVKSLPRFCFTLQDSGNKLHHFEVLEQEGGKKATITLNKLSVGKKVESAFLKKLNTVKEQANSQSGGKKHKKHHKEDDDDSSSSSSSSSEDELYDRVKLFKKSQMNYQPINYWWYSPLVYTSEEKKGATTTTTTYTLGNNVWLPQFTYGLVPYVEIDILNTSSAFFPSW